MKILESTGAVIAIIGVTVVESSIIPVIVGAVLFLIGYEGRREYERKKACTAGRRRRDMLRRSLVNIDHRIG